MAKKKPTKAQRSFGEVLADIRELQERFGRVQHFLRMAEYLFEAIEQGGDVKAVAERVKPTFQDAQEAVRATEE